MRNQTK